MIHQSPQPPARAPIGAVIVNGRLSSAEVADVRAALVHAEAWEAADVGCMCDQCVSVRQICRGLRTALSLRVKH